MSEGRYHGCGMIQALFPLLLAGAALLTPGDDDRSRFLAMRTKALADAGQRHLELGVDLRREGLCVQAAEQIVRAVEVSGGQNPGALMVLRLMQNLDDAFWRKKLPRPGTPRLDSYAHEAHRLDLADEKQRLDAALWAWTHRLWEDAHAEYVEIVSARGEPLEFSKSGCLALESGTLPEKESQRIHDEAVAINDKLYIRDRFLAALPQLKELFEMRTPGLCVRSTKSLAEARSVHALVLQLLPVLEQDLGARPTRPLTLVVLGDVALYETYLDAVKMPEHKAALGFADQLSGIAVVCSGKIQEGEVAGVCLHEMTHSFHFAISRSSMPSWYSEGLAESYGGQGVYSLQEGKLSVGGVMTAARLEPLRASTLPFGLRELLEGNAARLLGSDPERAHSFYAESWAFVRFLRSSAGEDVARRFAQWEQTCRGALVDAVIAGLPAEKDKPLTSSDLFLKSFGKELPKLEDAFSAWLKKL